MRVVNLTPILNVSDVRTTFFAGLLAASVLTAQAPPSTDIYLIEVQGNGDERPTFSPPRNITDREGYDNQPAFLLDGKGLLYTSMREGQTEIFHYDLATAKSRPVTNTPESEYSPTPLAGGRELSLVRVEADGRQLLWRYDLSGKAAPVRVEIDAEPVGYHVWSHDGGLLLFVLGEPNTLQWVAPESRAAVVKGANIGRSFHSIPGTQRLSFVSKSVAEHPGEWWIESFDPVTGTITPIVALPGELEDLTWDSSGRVWLAQGAKLRRYCGTCGGGWRTMVDLGRYGLGNISRLAFSPDDSRLAIVVDRVAATGP